MHIHGPEFRYNPSSDIILKYSDWWNKYLNDFNIIY